MSGATPSAAPVAGTATAAGAAGAAAGTAAAGAVGAAGLAPPRSTPRRRLVRVLESPVAWLALVVVVVAALAVGSVHPPVPGDAARIARLDSVIKCPSCVDLSIAQSQAPLAVDLRNQVARWVHLGLSDAQIEQTVVQRYGPGALLVPTGSRADALLWVIPAVVVGGGAVLLGGYLWRRRRLEEAP